MNVSAIFQDGYDGELSGAVWIIDTAPNRIRFEEKTNLDPNSALFRTECCKTREAALCGIIWGIQDHYPDWEFISVFGVSLEASITKILQDDCEMKPTNNGFNCMRANHK